jgi:hypothetical protein
MWHDISYMITWYLDATNSVCKATAAWHSKWVWELSSGMRTTAGTTTPCFKLRLLKYLTHTATWLDFVRWWQTLTLLHSRHVRFGKTQSVYKGQSVHSLWHGLEFWLTSNSSGGYCHHLGCGFNSSPSVTCWHFSINLHFLPAFHGLFLIIQRKLLLYPETTNDCFFLIHAVF